MKNIIITGFLIAGISASAQTIRIADNNTNAPTGANIFSGASALQNAITAALTGDIVYITPSITSYGNATVGRSITIKGAGFGISEIAPRSSAMGDLTIQNSINGTDNVSGLTLTGFSFTYIRFALGTGTSPYNNITADNITGSYFQHLACVYGTDNLVIRNSYLGNIDLGGCSGMTNTKFYNNIVNGYLSISNNFNPLVSNNIFVRASTWYINAPPSSTGVRIEHNIFSGAGSVFNILVNGLVVNNIFYGPLPNGVTPFYSNTFSNNLVLSAFTFPVAALGGPANSGVGNIAGTGPLFTSAPVSSTYDPTYDYTLQAGSVCIGAATTGENIGPSGGLYPWTGNLKLRASSMPVITLFGNSGVVPQNQPLKSNIKAKSN